MSLNVAYKRVSTEKQDIRRQDFSFENLKIDKVYIDKLSGKSLDRPQLQKLMASLNDGDHLVHQLMHQINLMERGKL